MSKLSQEIQVLAGDVSTLRIEIEQIRTELRSVVEQFLDEHRSVIRGIPAQGQHRTHNAN